MIIICPACSTKFMLSSSALGSEGREVRCAKCSHQWRAMPERAEPEPLELTESPEEELPPSPPQEDIDEALLAALTAASPQPLSAKPTSLAEHPLWKIAAACMAICCLLLLAILARESLQSALSPLYNAMGYYPSAGVKLADVTLRELPSRRTKRYEIECNLWNTSSVVHPAPQLSMQIHNEYGEVLAEEASFLANTGQPIAKGKSVPCKGLRFEIPSSTAHLVVMDIGSPLELSLRSAWEMPEETNDTKKEPEND